MHIRQSSSLQLLGLAALSCLLVACGDSAGGGGGSGAGGEGGAGETLGFVVSVLHLGFPDTAGEFDAFDLDGRASVMSAPQTDECAHDDLATPGGGTGVDYGFSNVIDALSGFQERQIIDGVLRSAVKNGQMTILLEVTGLNDTQTDGNVSAQLFASVDSPPLGATGDVLPSGTLEVHPMTRLHSAVTTGEIVDGRMTAGPVDLRWAFDIMIVNDEFALDGAMIRIEFQPDGTLKGILHGFWPVADLVRTIVTPTTENGNAGGFTFEEGTAVLNQHADGGYDNGMCTSISTIFEFEAVPAFLVK